MVCITLECPMTLKCPCLCRILFFLYILPESKLQVLNMPDQAVIHYAFKLCVYSYFPKFSDTMYLK